MQLRIKTKKSRVRTLAVVESVTKDGGDTPEKLACLIHMHFGKTCPTLVVLHVLEELQRLGLVIEDSQSKRWTCTNAGMAEFNTIKVAKPDLLARTKTPEAPMLA